MTDPTPDLTADQWEAMYTAQCSATDKWFDQYVAEKDRKADETLLARIADLEASLATVNQRLAT
jgi:hypothetical protein